MKTPVHKFELELGHSHKAEMAKLKQRIKAYNISWTPHVWFADEWFSPNGVGGFAVPLSLGHKKLMILEKKYLGHLEGESCREFFKLACHETGHALDNAYKLRLSKQRQKLFGHTSIKYPKSYIPNPESNDHVHFLGDFYAQAHPDEDWAETVGHLLCHNKMGNKKYLNTKAWDKLCFVDTILKQLEFKIPKKTHHLTPYHVKDDARTFEQYLKDKKNQFHLNKKQFFSPEKAQELIKNNQARKPINNSISANALISKNRKRLISNIEKNTQVSPWYIERCLLTLKKECKQNKYQLKSSKRPALKKIEKIISTHLEDFIRKGHTRIYM